MAIYLYDHDLLDKLEAVEGSRWRQDDERRWRQYREGDTAHAFIFGWNYTHSPQGSGIIQHSPEEKFWRDYFAGAFPIELTIIYGGNGSRYAVSDVGEVIMEAGDQAKVRRAQQVGFRITVVTPNPRSRRSNPSDDVEESMKKLRFYVQHLGYSRIVSAVPVDTDRAIAGPHNIDVWRLRVMAKNGRQYKIEAKQVDVEHVWKNQGLSENPQRRKL